MKIESKDEQERLKRLMDQRLRNRFSSGGYLVGGEMVPDDERAKAAITFSLAELEKASSGE